MSPTVPPDSLMDACTRNAVSQSFRQTPPRIVRIYKLCEKEKRKKEKGVKVAGAENASFDRSAR